MNSQPNEQAAKTSIHDQVERVAKTLPVALAGIYVIGFLIVALHLAGYGTSSLDLFKIQYLAAGFWFGAAFVFFFVITLPLNSRLNERHHGGKSVFWADGGLRTLAAVAVTDIFMLVAFAVLTYLTPRILSIFSSEMISKGTQRVTELAHSVQFLVLGLIIFDVALRLWDYLRKRERESQGREVSIRQSWWIFGYLVVPIFVLCIELFARDVYPTIPFSFGGGQPRQVVFWLGPALGTADSFLERDSSNPAYTVQYELLLENENSLVLISRKNNQRAIEFDRKAVGAVIVRGKRPSSAPAHFDVNIAEPANNKYEVIERTQKEVPNFMAKGFHAEVEYVLLRGSHKYYASCDLTTLDKLDPRSTCGFRVLRSYECVQPADSEPKKVLSDLTCKDDAGHPVYLYVSKKE
jgi:hypothetical protein